MKAQLVAYFASPAAFSLWCGMTILYALIVLARIYFFNDDISLLKLALSTGELAHFWLPIFWGKYLFRHSD